MARRRAGCTVLAYGMNPLFDTPLTGSDIPEWHVQPILRHLPDSSIRRQRVG